MRTIKFRGIWFEDGSWVYGNYVSKDQYVRSCIDGHVTHVEHYDYIVNQDEVDNLKYHQVHPDTVCQFTGFLDKNGKEKRKNEDSSTKTLVKLRHTEEQCYKLERENQNLKRFEKAIHAFVKDKNLYMKKDNECHYWHRGIPVCSTYCLECSSCLGYIEGLGVICAKRLKEANVSFSDNE